MRTAFKYIWKGLLVLLLIPLFYFFVAILGSVIPVNSGTTNEPSDVQIFLSTNGVHTSFVLPQEAFEVDWSKVVDPQHSISQPQDFKYISFGWGDLEFYKNTPQWKDLTLATGFKALFLNTPSALHVEFHRNLPSNQELYSVYLSEEQYHQLAAYILDSFEMNELGNPIPVADLHYDESDVFYRARRHLNLFYTCNTWTNNALKRVDKNACLWTPFEEGVISRYR